MKRKFIILVITLVCASIARAQTQDYDKLIQESAEKKDTDAVIKHLLKKISVPGIDTSGFQKVFSNNIIYRYLFKYSNKKSELMLGANYMLHLLEIKPANEEMSRMVYANFIDTYASLLYKSGQRREAIAWEEKSLPYLNANGKEQAEAIIYKMKKNLPVW